MVFIEIFWLSLEDALSSLVALLVAYYDAFDYLDDVVPVKLLFSILLKSFDLRLTYSLGESNILSVKLYANLLSLS